MTGAVLLASGGLDSTTLAYWLREREILCTPLFLDYGQHCASTEWETLRSVMPPEFRQNIERLEVRDIYKGSSSRLIREADLWKEDVEYVDLYLPYRNLLMLSIAAAFAQSSGANQIYAGFINSNHAQEIDCSAAFFAQLAVLLTGFGPVKVEMPFRSMSKYEVALEGIRLGAPIAHTFSCQASSSVPCGACPNCVDRLDALREITGKGF